MAQTYTNIVNQWLITIHQKIEECPLSYVLVRLMREIRGDKKVSSKSWQTWLDCLSRDALRSQFSFCRASALDVAASRDFSVSSSLDSLASRFALKDWVSRKASDNCLAVESRDLIASTLFAWKQVQLPLQWPPATWYQRGKMTWWREGMGMGRFTGFAKGVLV